MIRASKQVLNILKQGLKIEGDNWALIGDLDTQYINQYIFGSYDGCWGLNMEGLQSAISDIKRQFHEATE